MLYCFSWQSLKSDSAQAAERVESQLDRPRGEYHFSDQGVEGACARTVRHQRNREDSGEGCSRSARTSVEIIRDARKLVGLSKSDTKSSLLTQLSISFILPFFEPVRT